MERLEQGPSPVRNIERDKQSFLEAISSHAIKEIPTEFDENATQLLSQSVRNTKLFILGEMHGVRENPDIIYTLFRRFGFRDLALEWSPELRETAERYVETGELDFETIKDSPDGTVTAGHFALLKKLRGEGMLNRLICFDGGATGPAWNDRDEAMARNILAEHSDMPMLVVAGNLHAHTEPLTFDDESDVHHPMGESIKSALPEVSSGRIEYTSGQFHNFETRNFVRLSEGDLPTSARFSLDEEGKCVFELPVAHVATVPNPHKRL